MAGHSNDALTAAYIAAYGGKNIAGVVLKDPPVFSTEGEGWGQSFAYLDTYKNVHDYNNSDKSECWEAYYLRNCYWGQLFMKNSMPRIANYAQEYDFVYGEHFYDLTWNHGHTHKQMVTSPRWKNSRLVHVFNYLSFANYRSYNAVK